MVIDIDMLAGSGPILAIMVAIALFLVVKWALDLWP